MLSWYAAIVAAVSEATGGRPVSAAGRKLSAGCVPPCCGRLTSLSPCWRAPPGHPMA
ncbi:hypothetical protein I552_6521 [Mycobacterium xenopi 3993]|nr:hypothetical protein I552_6521 [Mycobacterium xenopi 3993]